MPHSPSLLVTLFAFLLLLGPLVVIHELGHYAVARLFGVRTEAFSVGFGRELFGRTDRRGTRWKISAIPLGGYVQFAGDWNELSMPKQALDRISPGERAGIFHFKPLWQRSLIVLAGPLTNLLFAIAIFAAFNMAYGQWVVPAKVAGFPEQSAAREAGLKIGDEILAINGREIESFTQIRELVAPFPGRSLTVRVERDGQVRDFTVPVTDTVERDEFGNEAHVGRIGIAGGAGELVKLGPVEAVGLAGRQTIAIVRLMVTGVGQILMGERSVRELGGPIRIAKYSGEQLSLGWLEFVSFAALISINLAFINLLPIPALDGGHLAFYAAEAVRRKPLGQRSQEWAFRMGLAFVLALMLFVTINDLVSLPIFGR